MKQYLIDELRLTDYQKIKAYLDNRFGVPILGSVYFILLNDEILSEKQISHLKCKPFYFAIDLQYNQISCELLIRNKNNIKCDCIAYASKIQRNWIIQLFDDILEELKISI